MSQGSEISGIDNIYPDTLVLHNVQIILHLLKYSKHKHILSVVSFILSSNYVLIASHTISRYFSLCYTSNTTFKLNK